MCGLVGRYQHFREHTASVVRSEYEGIILLQNIIVYLQAHMELQTRKPSSLWEPKRWQTEYLFRTAGKYASYSEYDSLQMKVIYLYF